MFIRGNAETTPAISTSPPPKLCHLHLKMAWESMQKLSIAQTEKAVKTRRHRGNGEVIPSINVVYGP